jgi:hypothetical protein
MPCNATASHDSHTILGHARTWPGLALALCADFVGEPSTADIGPKSCKARLGCGLGDGSRWRRRLHFSIGPAYSLGRSFHGRVDVAAHPSVHLSLYELGFCPRALQIGGLGYMRASNIQGATPFSQRPINEFNVVALAPHLIKYRCRACVHASTASLRIGVLASLEGHTCVVSNGQLHAAWEPRRWPGCMRTWTATETLPPCIRGLKRKVVTPYGGSIDLLAWCWHAKYTKPNICQSWFWLLFSLL